MRLFVIGTCVAFSLSCYAPTTIQTSEAKLAASPLSHSSQEEPLSRNPPPVSSLKVQNPVAASKLSKDAQELIKYSPSNAEVVFFVDTAQVKTGAIWDAYGSLLEDELNKEKAFKDFVKESNWNPLEKTSYAYLALKNLDQSDPDGVIVLRAQDSKNFQDALAKDPSTKQSKYKGNVLYSYDDVTTVFPTADTIILGDTALVKEALAAGGASKDVQSLLGSADTSVGMYGAFLFSKTQKEELSAEVPLFAGLSGLYFSLNAAKGVDFLGGAKFPSKEEADSAKFFVSLALSAQEDQWKDAGLWPYFKSLKVDSKDTNVVFSWKLTDKDAMDLIDLYTGNTSNTTSFSKDQHKSKLGGKPK